MRFFWEANEDVVWVSRASLLLNVVLSIAVVVLAFVIFQIFHRPMPVLSDDLGFVRYHTTEVYRLKPERVKAFMDLTLAKMLTVFPSYYDLTSVEPYLSQKVLANFTGANNADMNLRQQTERRQLFNIYEIRRYHNPAFPQYRNFIVRGELTTYERKEDRSHNVTVLPQSNIVHWSVYLQQVTPTPDNPYGLIMVGASPLTEDEAHKFWPSSTPVWPPESRGIAP